MDLASDHPSKSTNKGTHMDKSTPKNSFEQWFSPINFRLFEEKVKTMKLDYYTKKFTTDSFLKLLLFCTVERNGKSTCFSRLPF